MTDSDVWLLDTVRTPIIPRRPRSDELKTEIYFLRQEVVALREQLDALMAQLAHNPPPLRLHKPAALPSKEKPPIKRIELYTEQNVQCVRAYGQDGQLIPALCGPLDLVHSLLREYAGRKVWAETFSSSH